MFTTTTSNLPEPAPLDKNINGEFAISFSKLADGSRIACFHDINDAVIGAGVPVSFSGLCSIIGSVHSEIEKQSDVDNWCNPKILYRSASQLLWYRPSGGYTPLWFRVDGGCCIKAKLPTLVFCYQHDTGNLTIFATTTKSVNKDTPLFHAPLCNINSAGNLCFGSADKPVPFSSDANIIKSSEDAVLSTMFSHVNHPNTFTCKEDVDTHKHIAFWQALSEKCAMPTSKDLVKTKLKVSNLVGDKA